MSESARLEALSSEEVSRNLIYAGLFLVAHELIGNLVVSRVKQFYAHTTFGPGLPFNSYDADVLSRHRNAFQASLFFLRDHLKALTSEQVLSILAVRTHRNLVAHEMSEQIVSLDPVENERLLTRARDALFTLSNLWTYIEIGADPELASRDIDWSQAHGDDLVLLDRVIEKTRSMRNAETMNDG